MTPKPDYCALLANAEKAYDAWLGGQGVVEFEDQNGERLRYSPVNLNALAARIEQLRRLCDTSYGRHARPRPIGFLF